MKYYEIIFLSILTLAGKLNDFQQVPKPKEGETYCFPLASMKAFTTLGKTLTFSTPMWDEFEKEFYDKYETMGIPKDVYQRSIAYGEKVAEHVLFYAESDHYKQTRGLRYTITDEPGSWQPTPPTYAEACEPQWNTIRSFTLDTCSQFTPPLPVAYDMSENSKFHELLMEVYDISRNQVESVPEWISRSGITFQHARVRLNLLYSYTSQSYADALNTKQPNASGSVGLVPAYQIVDINADVEINQNLQIRLNLNNAFNEQYFTKRPQFYPGPGIWPSDGRSFSTTVLLQL